MGTVQTTQAFEQWTQSEWESLPDQVESYNRLATLRNVRTGTLVDQYQLSWNSKSDYLFYLRSFQWRHRKINCSPVVASVGLRPLSKGGFCNERWTASIYLEHVALRLSQIDEISVQDSLYILLTALQGYQQLYLHAGYFRVEQDQICIDGNGKVKVWVNGNLQRNYPQNDPETECLRRDQTHMVRQLVDLIQTNTDNEQFRNLPLLSNYLSDMRRRERCQIGFERAESAILNYASSYGITISNRMESAVELFQSDKKEHHRNNTATTFVDDFRYPRGGFSMNDINNRSAPNLMHSNSQQQSARVVFVKEQQSNQQNHAQNMQRFQMFQPAQQPQPVHLQNEQTRTQQFVKQPEVPTFSTPQQTNNPEVPPLRKSPSVPVKESRPTTNTKSMVVGFEETTQNQSIHLQDENSTVRGGSQKEGNYFNQSRAKNYLRYSQNIEENVVHHFSAFKFNRDTFGLPGRKFMKESTSSYRIPSSNSSKRNSSRRTPHSRSYKASSQKSSYSEVVFESRQEKQRYFVSLGEEMDLDPVIAADLLKYLG